MTGTGLRHRLAAILASPLGTSSNVRPCSAMKWFASGAPWCGVATEVATPS